MSNKTNVIDFVARKKSQNETKHSRDIIVADIVDMSERRQTMLKEERRQVKRTILTEFIGGFVVLPQHGLQKVMIYDISEKGVSFDLDLKMGHFRKDEELAMRIYLTNDTYFPITLKITNVREDQDDGVYRHGTEFVKGMVNEDALKHFVKFLETVSASLKSDHGDILVSNLK